MFRVSSKLNTQRYLWKANIQWRMRWQREIIVEPPFFLWPCCGFSFAKHLFSSIPRVSLQLISLWSEPWEGESRSCTQFFGTNDIGHTWRNDMTNSFEVYSVKAGRHTIWHIHLKNVTFFNGVFWYRWTCCRKRSKKWYLRFNISMITSYV